MQHLAPTPYKYRPATSDWINQIFSAKAARRGGIVRRSVRDVEREIGRDALYHAVNLRGFHLLEWGDQFIICCSTAPLKMHF